MLRLSVIKGPDKGKTQVFHSARVTIGDDNRNDFKLSDEMVSRFHGVFEVVDDHAFLYRDLGSLNGSYVRGSQDSHTLHDRTRPQSVQLAGRARVAVGRTLLEVELNPSVVQVRPLADTSNPEPEPEVASGFNERRGTLPGDDDQMRENIVRRVNEAPEHLAQRISITSDRIQVLFRLARRLNALNRIEDILDLVREATFEIFPLANFFAIVVPTEEKSDELSPLYIQMRDGSVPHDVILSRSLLREVVERRESVLYVRDNLAQADTRKSIVMAKITACLAAPLFGQHKMMGVMQVDSRGRTGMFGYDDLDLFTVLASNAAFAMERAALSRNIFEMFEAFVYASIAAIDARDPTTAGHSQRVADYTILTAERINHKASGVLQGIAFDGQQLTELRYAALMHDFGKIGVREEILQKPSRLMPGTCSTLLQRIETACAVEQAQAMRRVQQVLLEAQRAPRPEDIARIDHAVIGITQRFERFRDFVLKMQAPRPISDADLALIHEMKAVLYTDLRGETHRLITDEEAVDLSIPMGTLNAEERRHIESHAALTSDYLSRIPWSAELGNVPCIAGQHHEKLDGSGYPVGLLADQIVPQVRILTICDIFDALTATDRPYKRAKTAGEALDILRYEVDSGKLDGNIVELFAEEVVPMVEHTLIRSRE